MLIDSIISVVNSARLFDHVASENSLGRIAVNSNSTGDAPSGVRSGLLKLLDFESRLQELIQKLNLENDRMLISKKDKSETELHYDDSSVKDRTDRVWADSILQQQAALAAEAGSESAGTLNSLA